MAVLASSSSAFPMLEDSSGVVLQWKASASRRYQIMLDRMAPYPPQRWVVSVALAVIYGIRTYYLQAFYIVTYGLGIYILNLLIGFLSPQVDPERGEEEGEGPSLPSRDTDEFKPFVRRLPEFKFWCALTKAICVAFVMTFFSIFDIPVFWPILLVYWIALFILTMKRQIKHMIKYRYVPFSTGKPRYMGKNPIPDKVPDEPKEDSSDHSSLDNHPGAEIESLRTV